MTLTESMASEFDREMANTRKALERIPTDKLSWKPHEKSFTLGALAQHLAELGMWAENTLNKDELDLKGPFERKPPGSAAEILQAFDDNRKSGTQAFASTDDGKLAADWTLKVEGRTLFSRPRAAILRDMVISHAIHHRGQLTVYLRLLDVPVPAIYGPSADEGGF
jgi:uncharacterized damage-inducible protein DinB